MADSPVKTKAEKRKRRRITRAVRLVFAIFDDGWLGSEDWMVLQGFGGHNSVGGLSKIEDSSRVVVGVAF